MPPFPKPSFDYTYDAGAQIDALRTYRDTAPGRQIPAKASDRLLLATWNIANLGVQKRIDSDYRLIAEIVGWFDMIAVQEVNDNLSGILAIKERLPARYALLFSDASGNLERQAFLYDTSKIGLLEEVGRLAIPPSQLAEIKVAGTTTPFPGFDRGPYLGTFETAAVPVPGGERPPVLRLDRPGRHRSPDARDLRRRLVGRPAAPRQEHLRDGHHPARRLQPAEGRSGRPDLQGADGTRPRRAAAHLPDRVGDRLGQLLRPDRVLPRPDPRSASRAA